MVPETKAPFPQLMWGVAVHCLRSYPFFFLVCVCLRLLNICTLKGRIVWTKCVALGFILVRVNAFVRACMRACVPLFCADV